MQQLVTDYKIVFGSEQGKRVMADLEAFCGYNRCHLTVGGEVGSKTSSQELAFLEGQRNVVLRIKRILKEDRIGFNEIKV